jgi:hypothetical protein
MVSGLGGVFGTVEVTRISMEASIALVIAASETSVPASLDATGRVSRLGGAFGTVEGKPVRGLTVEGKPVRGLRTGLALDGALFCEALAAAAKSLRVEPTYCACTVGLEGPALGLGGAGLARGAPLGLALGVDPGIAPLGLALGVVSRRAPLGLALVDGIGFLLAPGAMPSPGLGRAMASRGI